MKPIPRLVVSLQFGEKELHVGELAREGKAIYFKYYPEFVETGLQISPFKLPLSNEILTADTPVFDGLFGVFNDSLPDGWGKLLLDRALAERNMLSNNITPLERLSFVGQNGMGALIYKPAIDSKYDIEQQLELDAIAAETQKVLEGASSDVIEALFTLGGSSGGARPKIVVGYNPKSNHIVHGESPLLNFPKDQQQTYEHWIIKFSASSAIKDIAQVEYAYHLMALDAGIEMSKCQLFESRSGRVYFGTKRFDRVSNQRIHMHSAAGLMHDNFRLSSLDYGHLMDAAFQLENQIDAYRKVLRLAAFNIFAHNRDDHSKNFSFLMNHKGHWQLAPAYDLTFSSSSHGFHSTTVAGEGRSPDRSHLLELARVFGMPDAVEIIDQVADSVSNWKKFAKEAAVSKSTTQQIAKVLKGL